MTAPEVSGIASSIDVPVYLLTVVNPLDHPGGEFAVVATDGQVDEHRDAGGPGALDRRRHAYRERAGAHGRSGRAICSWSCGISTSSRSSRDARPGWHPLEIRTRKKNLIVHARSGYMAGPARVETYVTTRAVPRGEKHHA